VVPYLKPLVEKLAHLLVNGRPKVKDMAIAAIAATAVAAEEHFLPYFEHVLNLMRPLMRMTEEEELPMRGRAMECVGHMAIAVGRAPFEPYVMECMEVAVNGMQLGCNELDEYTFAFFCNVSKVLEEAFGPFLATLVPPLFDAVCVADGEIASADFGSDEEGGAYGEGLASESDEDDAADGGGRVTINVRTGVLDKKAGAIEALGALAQHTRAQFAPYIDRTLEILKQQDDYFHENVRTKNISALPYVLLAAHACSPFGAAPEGEQSWVKGQPAELPPATQAIAKTVMDMLTATLKRDDDKEVVARAVEGVQKLSEAMGPVVTQPYMQELGEALLSFMQENSSCQRMEDDEEGDMDDDDADHDNILMDAVADLIGALAKAWGVAFCVIFDVLLPVMLKFARSSRPANDRSMAIGALAEVLDELGEGNIAQYLPTIMPACIKGISDSAGTVRRNAAFCVGVACENAGEAAAAHYPAILRGLQPLFQTPEGEDEAIADNAAAALARMIMSSPASLPLEQVLPVLLNAMPLKADLQENAACFTCVLSLLSQNSPQLQAHVPQLIAVSAAACVEDYDLEEEIKEQVAAGMKHLWSVCGEQMGPICAALPEDQKAAAAAWLQ
jgi:hypothetical protein